MNALITGAAGFIGSHLTDKLLSEGWCVTGVDSFTDYYDNLVKERNLEASLRDRDFRLVTADLLEANIEDLLDGIDVVFHLAGQPGVRGSWGTDFRTHVERNIVLTQKMLEAARSRSLRKFVFASSSSVYGNSAHYPTAESSPQLPVSPYGVSKLAAEKLCLAYGQTFGIPIVALRYFTVYGPRQRPDMAFNRFITWMNQGSEVVVYGDGTQRRDFTFVADAVQATIQAGICEAAGLALNVGGGKSVALADVLNEISKILDKPLRIKREPRQLGDVEVTGADITLARELLGYSPSTPLAQGLRAQAEYQEAVS